MDINLLKTIVTRVFGIYSQFKSIVSDLETNNTLDNREWAEGLLNELAVELNIESDNLINVINPYLFDDEKKEAMFSIEGIVNVKRNPKTKNEFWELFIYWVQKNNFKFEGGVGPYREEEEDELLARK